MVGTQQIKETDWSTNSQQKDLNGMIQTKMAMETIQHLQINLMHALSSMETHPRTDLVAWIKMVMDTATRIQVGPRVMEPTNSWPILSNGPMPMVRVCSISSSSTVDLPSSTSIWCWAK